MAEGYINLTEGSGKKSHTFQRTIGANTVEDSIVIPGEHYLAAYSVVGAVSVATTNDHFIQLMAGGSLNVRIRRMFVEQEANATTAAAKAFEVLRLTSAGTGGSAVTPAKYDPADGAAGATAMTLPSSKGSESSVLHRFVLPLRQAILATGAQVDDIWEWEQHPGMKPIIIAAGTSNGIAIKILSGAAGATMVATIEFTEANF